MILLRLHHLFSGAMELPRCSAGGWGEPNTELRACSRRRGGGGLRSQLLRAGLCNHIRNIDAYLTFEVSSGDQEHELMVVQYSHGRKGPVAGSWFSHEELRLWPALYNRVDNMPTCDRTIFQLGFLGPKLVTKISSHCSICVKTITEKIRRFISRASRQGRFTYHSCDGACNLNNEHKPQPGAQFWTYTSRSDETAGPNKYMSRAVYLVMEPSTQLAHRVKTYPRWHQAYMVATPQPCWAPSHRESPP